MPDMGKGPETQSRTVQGETTPERPAHLSYLRRRDTKTPKDSHNIAIRPQTSEGQIEMSFGANIGIMRILLTDAGLPPEKVDQKISGLINTLTNLPAMNPDKRKRAFDSLDGEVNRWVIKRFPTYWNAYAAVSDDMAAVDGVRAAFNASPKDSPIRVSLARMVLTKADEVLTDKTGKAIKRLREALAKKGVSQSEIDDRVLPYSGISHFPTADRLLSLALLRGEIEELEGIPNEHKERGLGEPMSKGQIEALPKSLSLRDRLDIDKKLLSHLVANLLPEEPDSSSQGVLADVVKFDQLSKARQEETAQALISAVHLLARKNADRYLRVFALLDEPAKAAKLRASLDNQPINVFEILGERERASQLREVLNGSLPGDFEKGEAAREIAIKAIDLIASKQDDLLGSLDEQLADIGGQASNDVKYRVWNSTPSNIDEALEHIRILQSRYEEALLSAFPIYTEIWDRLQGYEPDKIDFRYRDTGVGMLERFGQIKSRFHQIRKAEALRRRLDASFEAWNKQLGKGLLAGERDQLKSRLLSGPRPERLRVLGRTLRPAKTPRPIPENF